MKTSLRRTCGATRCGYHSRWYSGEDSGMNLSLYSKHVDDIIIEDEELIINFLDMIENLKWWLRIQVYLQLQH